MRLTIEDLSKLIIARTIIKIKYKTKREIIKFRFYILILFCCCCCFTIDGRVLERF